AVVAGLLTETGFEVSSAVVDPGKSCGLSLASAAACAESGLLSEACFFLFDFFNLPAGLISAFTFFSETDLILLLLSVDAAGIVPDFFFFLFFRESSLFEAILYSAAVPES
ncbi:MAG TPA: hypothetical protein DF610_17265, partial [Sphingobacterium sp.]|nr:hypothetical protein [Sphingobacterium sp.]